MLYLEIETSCDETACALVEDGRKLISGRLVSQTEVHKAFGGGAGSSSQATSGF
ncbi:MAG: hypothetical protein IPM93_23995 [Candidatus Obscuribacter sp.]|nr:hypothetical protein [Candidatus Obscuribacter sp.]